MNLIIIFILNILSFSLSYTSSQDLSNLQRDQSRRVSIRNIPENYSLGQTPIFAQGETPLFGQDGQFSQVGDTPILNPVLVQSIQGSPISPSLEPMLESIFNEYYYNQPDSKKSLCTELEEKKRMFYIFLRSFKIDSYFFTFDEHDLEKKFRQIYGIELNKQFTEDQEIEFEKYIRHEEAKEKIRQKHRIEKAIDTFIEENKKIEAVSS